MGASHAGRPGLVRPAPRPVSFPAGFTLFGRSTGQFRLGHLAHLPAPLPEGPASVCAMMTQVETGHILKSRLASCHLGDAICCQPSSCSTSWSFRLCKPVSAPGRLGVPDTPTVLVDMPSGHRSVHGNSSRGLDSALLKPESPVLALTPPLGSAAVSVRKPPLCSAEARHLYPPLVHGCSAVILNGIPPPPPRTGLGTVLRLTPLFLVDGGEQTTILTKL